jgi:hypothetical protein
MFDCLPKLASRSARQGVALLALAGFLAGTLGVPLPARKAAKDTSRPFPCQARQCGCMNAAQCWRECCCYTNRQKLAWADANGIKVPQFVLSAAKREETEKDCTSTCCSQKSSTPELAKTDSPLTLQLVLAIQARQCRGQAEQWLSLGAVELPPASIEMNLVPHYCGELSPSDEVLVSVASTPSRPPPRSRVVS